MMGRQTSDQSQLFYLFNLERRIPAGHLLRRIDRTERAFGLKPKRLTADTAYGTGKLLAWLLGRDIAPHIPVWERYERTDGMFARTAFAYDAERDVYICPNARPLRTSGTVHDGRVRNYLSQPGDCRACELKERC